MKRRPGTPPEARNPVGLRRKHVHTLLSAALVLCTGCVSRFRVVGSEDPFFQTSARRMVGNALEPGLGGDWVTLDAEARRSGGDSVRYTIVLGVRSTDEFLGVSSGESLILLIDSARIALSSPTLGTRRRRVWGTWEESRYPVPITVIRRIGDAHEVRARVVGRRGYIDRVWSAENIHRFRDFANGTLPTRTPGARRRRDSANATGAQPRPATQPSAGAAHTVSFRAAPRPAEEDGQPAHADIVFPRS